VAVIETDKVNVDIRSTHSGVIKKYFANEGDTVQVDANFFELDTDGKGGAPQQAAAPAKEAPAAAPKKVIRFHY
jgi:2-oxoglutarate dehydrogenase E2 component (dihydrolipoamide succinyltransferase)